MNVSDIEQMIRRSPMVRMDSIIYAPLGHELQYSNGICSDRCHCYVHLIYYWFAVDQSDISIEMARCHWACRRWREVRVDVFDGSSAHNFVSVSNDGSNQQ